MRLTYLRWIRYGSCLGNGTDGEMHAFKNVLNTGLPSEFISKRTASVNIYALGPALDLTPQSVHEWIRKDRISVPSVAKLMGLPNHSFTVEMFRPYCPELGVVMDMLGIVDGN